jgi:microcystin-dependent protein
MATTTSGFRYPVSADDPDIPRDIRQLAEDIDNYLNATGGGAFNGVLPVIDINGNSTTATRLATGRTISLTGSLSGSASFDGSANISISASVDPLAGTVPTGAMVQYLGTTAPNGWLFCTGSAVSRSTYSSLFDLFGTRYGAGNGSTTFNLPDMRERFARGSALTGTLSGTAGGSATHQHTNTGLSTGSAGGHNHEVNVPAFTQSGDGGHSHVVDDHYHTTPDHSHGFAHTHNTTDHSHDMAHTHNYNPPSVSDTSNASSSNNTVFQGTGTGYNHANQNHTHSVTINIGEEGTNGSIRGGVYSNSTDGASAGNSTGNPYRTNAYSNTSDGASDGNTSAGASYNGGNDSTTTSTTHSHTIDIAAFNTSGGEGAHTHGQGTSDTISNIPPYIDVNYIVKI